MISTGLAIVVIAQIIRIMREAPVQAARDVRF